MIELVIYRISKFYKFYQNTKIYYNAMIRELRIQNGIQ